MRKQRTRTPVMLALAGMLASLVTFVSSGMASAAESIPETQWSPKVVSGYEQRTTTSPQGTVTEGCVDNSTTSVGSKLRTYSATGSLVQEISSSQTIDGIPVCISKPTVGKNGDVYGSAGGVVDGYWKNNPNLLAYKGNTLRWKYSTGCDATRIAKTAVGADGNVYFINSSGRLVGLTPDVQPPLTTPAKVLDVPVSGTGCGTEVRTFKNGIAVVSDSWWVYFYTYDGTYLGSRNANDEPAINAAGRLFSPTWTGSGDNRGIKISAYDPIAKKVAWTAQESSFGQTVDFYETYPTPDGGAVVLVQRTKVVSGAPTSERVFALVKLDAYGIKVWDKDLPNKDTSGVNTAGNNYITVDTTGKLVLVRDWTKQLTSSPWQVPFITIDILNVATGNAAVATKVMTGNLDAASGNVNGYQVRYNGVNGPITGADTLYLHAACKVSCAVYDETKLYPIKVTGLGLDYPRGAVLAREKRPATPYLALGDSFSAGEGVEPFEPGTNFSGVNECHRSDSAYARLISGSSPKIPALGVQGFRACSGAVSENIRYAPQWNEPGAQLDLPAWPDNTTQLVTMTIGGNDIDFGPTIKTCALEPQNCDSAFQAANSKVANLGDALAGTYTEVLKRLPNARVYVIGYAPMFAAGTGCTLGPNSDYPITESRKQQAIDLLNALNTKIKSQVDIVRAMNGDYQRLKYVPADGPNSPFLGKHICSSDPYFHGLNLSNQAYSFHPNAAGQQAYATVVANAINAG